MHILNSLYSDGSTETDLFCECLENVVNDCTLNPRQTDPLNILEPWMQVVAIDNGSWYVYSPVIMCLVVGGMLLNYLKACIVIHCSINKE